MHHTHFAHTTDYASTAATVALVGIALLFLLVTLIASYIICSFLLGRIFKKASIPQWIAWVPVYNLWKLLTIGDKPGFWAALGLLPFVNIVATIFLYLAMHRIGKKLGKDDWFVLLAIFLPVVWLLWLAFDDSKWPTTKKRVHKKN